jgi:hypothetical protein
MMWQVLKRADCKSWQEQESQWLWIVQFSTCKKLSMYKGCAPQEFLEHYFADLATLHRHTSLIGEDKTSAPWGINEFLYLSKEIMAFFSFLRMLWYHCHRLSCVLRTLSLIQQSLELHFSVCIYSTIDKHFVRRLIEMSGLKVFFAGVSYFLSERRSMGWRRSPRLAAGRRKRTVSTASLQARFVAAFASSSGSSETRCVLCSRDTTSASTSRASHPVKMDVDAARP